MVAITSGQNRLAVLPPAGASCERILLVDDHVLFAQGLAALLRQERLAESVINVTSAEKAADYLYHDQKVDLVLLDARLNGEGGLSLFTRLPGYGRRPPIVIVSGNHDEPGVRAALASGASGVLVKSASKTALVQMIQAVKSGQGYFPGNEVTLSSEVPLTRRQRDVLCLLGLGFPNKRICQSLNLTEHTVKTHLKAIFTELKVHNRTECVNKARNLGWL